MLIRPRPRFTCKCIKWRLLQWVTQNLSDFFVYTPIPLLLRLQLGTFLGIEDTNKLLAKFLLFTVLGKPLSAYVPLKIPCLGEFYVKRRRKANPLKQD
jgi:hypothetical protein